jgi:hypothetical protein
MVVWCPKFLLESFCGRAKLLLNLGSFEPLVRRSTLRAMPPHLPGFVFELKGPQE